MNRTDWHGVIPAITTPFLPDLTIDHEFVRTHVARLIAAGARGIVTPGSLGEGATLAREEKIALWKTCIQAAGPNVPVIAAIASASTDGAVAFARAAAVAGCTGLMVLPPYLYKGTWRETREHFSAVIDATALSCMLYNNPLAYAIDTTPDQIAELAQTHANLHAVKESSADVRRIHGIRAVLGDKLAIFMGVDDALVEGVQAGATGWIAGLVNALPEESVRLFELARKGPSAELDRLYHWFLPLLRMDVTYDFVQLIKLVQAEAGLTGEGGPITRPPRLLPEGAELAGIQQVIRSALAGKPQR